MTWEPISCEQRETLMARDLTVGATLTDLDGRFGEPSIYTEWVDRANQVPVLRDYRYPSADGGADRKPCMHLASVAVGRVERWVSVANLLPWRARDLPWTWEDEDRNTRTRQCLCCGRPGHYQQTLETHMATHGVKGLGILVKDGYVGDGHHRVVAALRLGIDKLPIETEVDAQARWVRDHGQVDWSGRKFGDR